MVVATWRCLKERIVAENPTVENPGQLAADLVVAKIKEIINQEHKRTGKRVRR